MYGLSQWACAFLADNGPEGAERRRISMPMCRICGLQHYPQSYEGPEDPCICGHGIRGESPWQYAKIRGVLARGKYYYLRNLLEFFQRRTLEPLWTWLYKPWNY